VIRVLLIGDVRVSREALASLLATDVRLEVTERAASGARRSGFVDVVVVDASIDGRPATLTRAIGDADGPIVVLGAPEDERELVALAELGVVGFVDRDASLGDLVASVVSAARGEASLPPRVATTLLRAVGSHSARRHSLDASVLTIRERQVVDLIGDGLSNKEIATELGIEVATVKNHVHNILEKLDVERRSDAVARLRIVEGDEMPTPLDLARARPITRHRVR
jgi:two-component system, NarL family, nitrate/nitrite response regulator NarL